MADWIRTTGWLFTVLGSLWVVLIVLSQAAVWLLPSRKKPGLIWVLAGDLIEIPVNAVRRTVPTVYRSVDLAPWLTILVLVLCKAFIFRALIYLGMLLR
ncbi:MAG: hypothetical protein HGA76_05595 [Candidatus Firestonebacteria bacterium]|nr:hypothetical protein [Candidatus Firestonebacteria bacterium]